MGNCLYQNDHGHPEKINSELNLSPSNHSGSHSQTREIPKVAELNKKFSKENVIEAQEEKLVIRDKERADSNSSRMASSLKKRHMDRIEEMGDAGSHLHDNDSDDKRSLYQTYKKSILSLPLRSIYDDSIVYNNEVRLEYVCGLTKDVQPRGHTTELVSKGDIPLLGDLLEEKVPSEERNVAKIVKEEHGLSIDILNRDLFRVRVNKVPFFLDMNSKILIGNPYDPDLTLQVTYLDYPKIRVNFNGFRIKTNEKDVNWSNYYMINERNQSKVGLHLQMLPRGDESGETIQLEDKSKHYFIGTDENCRIRSTKGANLGVIKFIEDVGWIVQAKETVKEDPAYGLYIKVRKAITRFKLYQGMSLCIGQHIVTIRQLS